MKTDILMKRIEALESEVRILRSKDASSRTTQNPFWFGIVLDTVAAATDPATGHTSGNAEILIPDRNYASQPDDMKAGGKSVPFVNRFIDLSLARGQLVLFARDWNKSIPITPACGPDHEDLLTLDASGEPL